MTVIVTDAGFTDDTWSGVFISADELAANLAGPISLDLPSDAAPEPLLGKLDNVAMIRIDFPGFSDGRGFTIARRLRLMGFQGHLRARGHVIADQYAMARRAGFDDIEIDDTLAARQPQEQWLARANWRSHDYQSRLRG